MYRVLIFALSTFQCLSATASEIDAYLYLGAGQDQSKVIYESGSVADVVLAQDGQRPDECPDGAFWLYSTEGIVDCSSGAYYSLKPASQATDFGVAEYQIIGIPNDKTDEPGPSVE